MVPVARARITGSPAERAEPAGSHCCRILADLSHPGHVLGEVGHLAVLTGLASADAYVRIAAAELWTKASLDDRLDPAFAAVALMTGIRCSQPPTT